MPEAKYRTGTAAKMLGISSYHTRRLAETELIDAEWSGHEWLFPASEIDRLLKEGVPEIPAAERNGEEAVVRNGNRHRANGDPAGGSVAGGDRSRQRHARGADREGQAELTLRGIRNQLRQDDDKENNRQRKATDETRRADWTRQFEEAALAVFDHEPPDANAEIRLKSITPYGRCWQDSARSPLRA